MGEGSKAFITALVFAFILFLLFLVNCDSSVEYISRMIQRGELLCTSHKGLHSYDNGGEFTCKNGIIIKDT